MRLEMVDERTKGVVNVSSRRGLLCHCGIGMLRRPAGGMGRGSLFFSGRPIPVRCEAFFSLISLDGFSSECASWTEDGCSDIEINHLIPDT